MANKEKVKKLPYFGLPVLFPYLKPYRKRMWIIIISAMGVSICDVVFPMFNRYALDHFIGQETFDTLVPFIWSFIGLLVLQLTFNFFSTYYCGRMEISVNQDLRNAAFHHLQELSMDYYNENNVGYIHARLMSDTGKIGEMVSWYFTDFIWQGSYLLFALINMFLLNAKLAGYVLLVFPFIYFVLQHFEGRLIRMNRKVREQNSLITSNFNEGITGISAIKTMAIEDQMNTHFQSDTLKMCKQSIEVQHDAALMSGLVYILSALTLSFVLYLGGGLTREQIMEIGTLSVFMTYVVGMVNPIQSLSDNVAQLLGIQVNIERFQNLLHTKPLVQDKEEVIEVYGDTFSPKKENWEEMIGDVSFEHVTFQYPKGEEVVLKDFNLEVKHGSTVAIVGETGAGKSTLVNLICRFYEPQVGVIKIDGKDIQSRSLAWLHDNIGYVLQTPQLFSGTIRENLKYGKQDASDEELKQALSLVYADFVLEKLPDGLDTMMNESGSSLSVGEQQLLSFARAILKDPKIFILDEATASIDSICEKAIQQAIAKILENRTSFVIAHRLSTIVDADVILVVDKGQIVEQGTHQELMAKDGYYATLYRQQFVKEKFEQEESL